jgi:uncharacterized coiled-coil DUF342 family protein
MKVYFNQSNPYAIKEIQDEHFKKFKQKYSDVELQRNKLVKGICGKLMYYSPKHVDREIKRIIKKDNTKQLNSYFCDSCCAWHMTSRIAWI